MATASQDPSLSAPPRYRAITLWAVLSLICGVASATMIFFRWLAIPLPLAAIYFGMKALGHIERVPEEYSGRRLAQVGIGLGAGLGILLSGWLIFFGSIVPHGYQVLNWADLEPNDKHEIVPPTALELADPEKKIKVYVSGYMLPSRQQTGLTEFSICRTSDQCRFASQLGYRPTDLIHIELTGDLTMDYTTHEIGVGGLFHVDLGSLKGTPYSVKGDYVYR